MRSCPKGTKCYYPKIRSGPIGCESCYLQDSPCSSCLQLACASPAPCGDARWSYCPAESDAGLLHTIRNGFQRIFQRKRGCTTTYDACKGRVYTYTTSQLKNIDNCLDKLEDEISCMECTIKEAYDCDYCVNCDELRCTLTNITERLEGIKGDLCCASDCFDPCRDRCEHDMISSMMDRVCCMESCVTELCCQIDYLICKYNPCKPPCEVSCRKPCFNKPCIKKGCCSKRPCKTSCDPCCTPKCTKPCCYKVTCRPDCQKPCCVKRTICEVNCRKPCCAKLTTCEVSCKKPCCAKPKKCRQSSRPCKTDLCRTSSVIPVGVMLVKL